ncbi:hypothetical protein Taro_044922 [Colocasia esculenta]|uniref:Uncharacterized protein n=1 Tax=Colocasia esculenta TaxID=4460 RepID=A0A843WPX6_COLES|nr:hypothetical protein [Colocasia esculenta]
MDVDVKISDLHALQTLKLRGQASPAIGEMSPTTNRLSHHLSGIEKTLARSCIKTELWRLQSGDSRLHPATYCIRRAAGTSGKTSPTAVKPLCDGISRKHVIGHFTLENLKS